MDNSNEQLLRDARRANTIDKERAQALSVLVKSEVWKIYSDLLNAKIAERSATLLEPLKHGERDSSEHNKGAVYGLIYARDLPHTIVAAMKELSLSSDAEDE